MKLLLATSVASAVFLSSEANAVTITFDDIAARGAVVGQSYVSEGFKLLGAGQGAQPAQFYVYNEGRTEWTGSPGLTLFAVGGRIELSRLDGGTFALQSIDLARGDSNRGLVPVGFTGYRQAGGTVQATYVFHDSIAGRLETFSFGDAFRGLTSMVWYQGAEWHQFDNIRIASAVPEPGPALLSIAGLLAVAVAARRKQRQAT